MHGPFAADPVGYDKEMNSQYWQQAAHREAC